MKINGSLVVRPPVYELQIGFGRWCKLSEVCAIIPELARINDIDFAPTPEDLVSRFAALARLNKIPENASKEESEKMTKKIFRYSVDGKSFWGKEVPIYRPMPPYVPFNLDIETPYPKGLFVREEWAADTLNAIRRGAIAAVDFGDRKIGFPPKGDLIHLEGKTDMVLVKLPECVPYS